MPGPLAVTYEHAATTVPDLGAAERFFVDVLGARVHHRSRFGAGQAFDMAANFNAHPDSTAALVSLELGGTVVELFAYDAPDQSRVPVRNCDVGGHHLGFRVTDLRAAVETLRATPGVTVLGEPQWSGARGWVYFLTPWGMQLELSEQKSSGTA